MTTTASAISAEDLRGGLLLGTQPSLRTEDLMALRPEQLAHLARFYQEHGVTRRRFESAAVAVNLEPAIYFQIVGAVFHGVTMTQVDLAAHDDSLRGIGVKVEFEGDWAVFTTEARPAIVARSGGFAPYPATVRSLVLDFVKTVRPLESAR